MGRPSSIGRGASSEAEDRTEQVPFEAPEAPPESPWSCGLETQSGSLGHDVVIRAPRAVSYFDSSDGEYHSPAHKGDADSHSASWRQCRYGATIVPIRVGANGGMEVLCAQNVMVNYLRTKRASNKVLMYAPCDVRFLGGIFEYWHATPLDTVLANLTSPGVRSNKRYMRSHLAERALLERAALQLKLFDVTDARTGRAAAKVYHFVCTMDQEVGDSFAAMLNQLLTVQARFCEEMGDALFSMREAVRAPLCPKFVNVRWMSADELLEGIGSSFFNAYMQREFTKHGVLDNERENYFRQNAHRDVLRKLCRMSVSEALKHAEEMDQSLRIPRMSVEELAASSSSEIQDIAPGLGGGLRILSFNLNVLPFGASMWGSGQGLHARARLRLFLDEIAEEVRRNTAPDVLTLQELFATPFVPGCCLQTRAIRVMARLGYYAATGGKPSWQDLARRRKWTDSGLVVFSRFPVVHQLFVPFVVGAGLDAGATKGALWVQLELGRSKCLNVVNCHLQASHTGPDGGLSEKVRRSQLQQLRKLLRRLGEAHPVVLTGDFNVDAIPEPSDPSGSYGLTLRKHRQDSKDYQQMLRMLDPDGEMVDLLCGPTLERPLARRRGPHPCTRPPRMKLPRSMQYMTKHKFPQRLDYVFYRPALPSLIEHAETHIVEFKVKDGDKVNFEYLSDHFGICARFRLRCGFSWSEAQHAPTFSSKTNSRARRVGPALWGRLLEVACIVAVGVLALSVQATVPRLVFAPEAGTLAIWARMCAESWRLFAGFPGTALGLLAVGVLVSKRNMCAGTDADVGAKAGADVGANTGTDVGAEAGVDEENAPPVVIASPWEALLVAVGSFGDRRCLGQRRTNPDASLGEYEWMTYREVQKDVLRISSGLCRKFDLRRNAKVGLLGHPSKEWILCDFALMRCGADTLCLTEPPLEVRASLDRSAGAALGCEFSDSDGRTLLITSISKAGLIARYNAQVAQKEIREGDRIVEVNGLRGDAKLLAAECERQAVLDVRVFHSPCELLLCSAQYLEVYVHLARAGQDTVPSVPIVVLNDLDGIPSSLIKLIAEAQFYGLQVFGLRFVAHFGEVAGWVPYIGIGGSHVFTTMYRSRNGFTSKEAEVRVSLQAMAMASRGTAQALKLGAQDVHFSYTSPSFFGERVILYATLGVGGAVGFYGGVRSPRIFEDIRELGPTFLVGTPSLFNAQLARLQALHVGALERLCFAIIGWALRRSELRDEDRNTPLGALARLCSSERVRKWLRRPFGKARAALIGRTSPRFVLALCSPGVAVMSPEICLWLRVLLGCPVFKGLVVAEAGGLATLGEAPCFGGALEQFAVGRALPGVDVDFRSKEDLSGLEAWGGLRFDANMIVVRGPFLVSNEDVGRPDLENAAELTLGVVGLRRGDEIYVFGRVGSIEDSLDGRRVLCDAVEQLLVQCVLCDAAGPWLQQLFLTSRSMGGVVGIGVVRLEDVWRLTRHCPALANCSAEEFCRHPEARALCLGELQRHARSVGLTEACWPRALCLELEPLSQERGLQTPFLQLRRDLLLRHFEAEIDMLYSELR